jgi:hypothetical protein
VSVRRTQATKRPATDRSSLSPVVEQRAVGQISEDIMLRCARCFEGSGAGGADVADHQYCSDAITGTVIDNGYPVFDS